MKKCLVFLLMCMCFAGCGNLAVYECIEHRDCGANRVCKLGHCISDKQYICSTDADCSTSCKDGRCMRECMDDSQCLFDEICRSTVAGCPNCLAACFRK